VHGSRTRFNERVTLGSYGGIGCSVVPPIDRKTNRSGRAARVCLLTSGAVFGHGSCMSRPQTQSDSQCEQVASFMPLASARGSG
jgi:hypothetical protein